MRIASWEGSEGCIFNSQYDYLVAHIPIPNTRMNTKIPHMEQHAQLAAIFIYHHVILVNAIIITSIEIQNVLQKMELM